MRSRMYARVLMVVAVFASGATFWKDPDMLADATRNAEVIRPVVANYLVGTPFENLLGPAVVEDAPAPETPEDEQLADASGLPASQVPVNRP